MRSNVVYGIRCFQPSQSSYKYSQHDWCNVGLVESIRKKQKHLETIPASIALHLYEQVHRLTEIAKSRTFRVRLSWTVEIRNPQCGQRSCVSVFLHESHNHRKEVLV
jgi:hypothetical protein